MQLCTPLNQAAAMLELSGQSDPQRYVRNTYTDRQTEIPCFYREMFSWRNCSAIKKWSTLLAHSGYYLSAFLPFQLLKSSAFSANSLQFRLAKGYKPLQDHIVYPSHYQFVMQIAESSSDFSIHCLIPAGGAAYQIIKEESSSLEGIAWTSPDSSMHLRAWTVRACSSLLATLIVINVTTTIAFNVQCASAVR